MRDLSEHPNIPHTVYWHFFQLNRQYSIGKLFAVSSKLTAGLEYLWVVLTPLGISSELRARSRVKSEKWGLLDISCWHSTYFHHPVTTSGLRCESPVKWRKHWQCSGVLLSYNLNIWGSCRIMAPGHNIGRYLLLLRDVCQTLSANYDICI